MKRRLCEARCRIAGAVAIASTVMAITRLDAMHALLYLIVSLMAVALTFFTLGAPFMAALEVIMYAGAIMVLFVFVVMMLNLGPAAGGNRAGERRRDVLRKCWAHYDRLRDGKPGTRFMQCYQRRQQEEREHPWKAALYVALGSILVALGMVFALLPVLPGFLLMVPGLVLLSSRS